MKFAFILLLFCGLASLSSAQPHPGFYKTYRYSGDELKRAEVIGPFIYSESNSSFYFSMQAFAHSDLKISSIFYKTDINGNVQREYLDTFPNGNVYYHALAKSYDNMSLYWGGASFTPGDTLYTKWVLTKTDTNLNIIWKKFYDVETTDAYTVDIINIPNSSDIALLSKKFTPENNLGYPVMSARIIIRRIDSAGNLISQSTPGPSASIAGDCFELTDDNQYLINGRTFSWGQNQGGIYCLKADPSGSEIWHKVYAENLSSAWLSGLMRSNEAGEFYYNIGTVAVNPDWSKASGFINKIDGNGNEVWNRVIENRGVGEGFYGICGKQNGACVTAGFSQVPSLGGSRGWLVSLDSSGAIKWNRLYSGQHPDSYDDQLYRVVTLPDGSIVASGGTFAQDNSGAWTQDGWLLRVDSNGCLTADCFDPLTVKEQSKNAQYISVYPNPSNGSFSVESSKPFSNDTEIFLADNIGRILKELPSPKGQKIITYTEQGLSNGSYILLIRTHDDLRTQKLIISK